MTSLYRRWFQFVGMALMAFTLTAVVPSQALAVDLDLDGIDDLGSPIGCNGDGDDLDPNVPVGGGNGNSDADSLTDGQELFCFGTNAGNSDTDGDGLNDDAEVIVYGTDPNSSDTDGDLMPDGWEVSYGLDPLVDDANGDLEGDGLNNVGEYLLGADPTNSDSDGDGMTDGWEVANSLNPAINDAAGDAEPDGLDNLGEFTAGTDPNVSDTDGDGLNDGNEVNVYGTDPLADADFDGDGIDDDVEILVLGTNHAAQDTDGDGLTDDYETGYGDANVNDYDVGTDLDPNFEDTDGDGMCDGSSQIAGCVGAEGTLGSNPLDVDSDNDGVCDGDGTEAACLALPSVLGENNLGTDPNDADTDDDGLADDVDSDPLDADADDDGLIDGTDDANSCYGVNDCDSDGLLDGVEYGVDTGSAPAAGNSPSGIAFAGSSGYSGDVDTGSTTDLNDDDSDDDGILDGTEDANGNGGVGITETDPNDVDTDSNDGLCDGAGAAAGCLVYNGGYGELDYGTDPLDSDTDGDTLTDGYGEVAALGGASTDPFDIDTDQDGWNDDLDTNNFDADQDDDGLADGADNAIGCVNSYDCDGDSLSDGLESGIATAAAPAGGNSTNSIAFAGTAGGYVGDADTGSTTNPNSNDTDSDGASDGREDTNGNGQVNAPEGNPNVDDAITLGGTISGINTWCPWGCDWLEVYLESPVGTVRANTLFTTTNGGYSTYNALDQVAITGQSYNVSVQYFNANWWTIVCGVSNATGVAGVSDINNIDILCTGYSDVNVYMHAPEWWDYNNINVYVSSDLFPPQVFTLSDGWNATYYANDLASISITTSVSGADRCIFEDGTTNRYTAPFNFGYGDHDVHLTCGTAVDLNVDLVNVQNAGQSTDVWASSDNWWLNWGTQTMNDGSPIATFTMVEGVNYYLGHNLYSAPVPQAQSCVFKRDNDPTQSWDGSSIDTWDDTWGVGSAINATLTCDETELYTVVLNLEAGSTDADIYLHTATGLWDTVAIYGADESDNGTTLMEVPMIPAASYFTTAFGSVCSTRYDGLIAYVTCGYEYAIGGKVMGSAGLAGDTVTLSLTSNNDSTVHLATLPADNIAGEGFNFAVDPATYVVQGSQWEVLVDTQPTTVGSFCSVSNGTGTATGSMAAPWLVTNTTVTCGLLRTITVEVTAQTGFDVDVALASSLGATQTQNNIMNGGSTTFQVVDGAVIDVTVADYNNHSAYCTVVGGTAVTVSGDLTVFINCGSTYTILGGAISNLTGSGLELRETNTGATAVPVGASYAFPQNILQTGAAYNVVISRQPTAPDQVCTLSGTTNGTVANQNVQGPDVDCNIVLPWYNLAVNVSGLAGDRVRLIEVAGSQVTNATADGLVTFARSVTNGTYTVQVDQQPAGPQQQCRFNNTGTTSETVVISNADATVNLTCFTVPQYSLSVNVSGLAGDRVRLIETVSGQVTNVVVDGVATFPTALTNGAYTVQVDVQPYGPAQTCRFDNTGTTSETVVIANASVAIDLTCVDNVYTVSALVEGKDDLAGDLVLNYNGVTYPVTTDTQVTFGSEIQGTPYLVTVETQPALPAQTCEVDRGLGMVGTSAVSDVAVTCTDDLFTVYANVSGLALGSSLLLSNNGDPMIVEGDGIWAFPVQLTGVGIYDVVMVDDTSFQTCVVSSAPSAGYLADADVTVDITCTDDQFYTIGVNVIGLAGDRVRLIEVASNQVTNAVASGVVTFATDLTNGTYTVQVDAQPNDENPNVTNYAHQVCLFDNGTTSRVVTLNNTNQVINLTCTTVTYTVSGNVRGLRTTGPSAPYTLTLTNNGGNAQVRSVNGAFTFTTQLAEGVAYNVAVSVQPVNQHCTVLNGSGVIGQSNANSVEVVCEHTDFDLDGIPDEQERNVYGTATDTTDSDGDGLNDYFETQTATTNPLTDDTDHDGALDADELAGYGAALTTDPLDRDTDNDGLTDGFEVGYGGNAAVYTAGVDLNPLDIDTDDGGIGDGVEVDSGNYVLFPATNPLVAADDILDTDGDSIPDIVEYNGASYFWGYRTNHLNPDSDNDGLSDAEEIYGYSTNALSDDSDGDGVSDVLEVETYNSNPLSTDTDGDNLSDWNEIFSYSTSPIENDTDQDGARDDYEVNGYGAGRQTNPLEVDTDHDGLYDGYEVSYCDSDPSDYDGGCDLDPTDPDTDDGGVKDGVEVNSGNTVLFPSTDPLNSLDDTLDSDLDGIPDIIEYNGASMAWGYQTDHRQSDTDHDGLSDSVEIYGYGTSAIDTDSDDDGLTDYVEVTVHHTNPLSVDSDNDGFTDPQEISTTRTDPKVEDTDGDGIRDYTEAMTIYTNPLIADTDADGLTDGYETARDGNAETYTAGRDYNPNVADTDDGGVSDGVEVKFDHTNPNVQRDDKIDRDNDNIYDWYEINEQGTNPEDRDTDGDGLDDGQELVLRTDLLDTDSDDDGLSDYNEVALYSSNPLTDDTDGDALSDPREINVYHTDVLVADSDRDGLTDGREVDVTRTDPLNSDSDNDRLLDGAEVDFHQTDPNHPDSDGDRIEDGDEVFHIGTDPAVADTDRDGISDGDEVLDHKTDPMDADSDNDGDSDGKEVNKLRTDPLDNDSNAIASSGAGGCSVAARGTTNNWNLLPIFAVALLVALRRKRVRLRPVMAALVAAIAVLVVSVPAQAKQLSFKPHNTQTFYMADDVGEYFVTRDSRTRKQLGFQVALGFNYSKEMLVVRENDKIKRVVIDRLLTEDTMLSFGIIDQLQLDVAVPYHVYVERGKVQNKETYKTNNWGDIRAGLKGRILDRMEYPVGLAVRGFVYTPTGREKQYLGAPGVEYGLQAIIDRDFEFLKLAANLGWVGRESSSLPGARFDDQFTWSVATDLSLSEHFGLIVDVFGATVLKDFFKIEYGSPIEGAVGGRYWLDNGFTMSAGLGRGVNSGAGAPPMRMNWEMAYQLPNDRDRDMDGFSDELDTCAGRAEDVDGYRDSDGCPDRDHDEDGVLDAGDSCPTVAEDRDGFDDRDGCPEFDNDGDGILDEVDRCPNAKETVNGYADGDGCPDAERISVQATIIDDESGAKLAGEITVDPKVGKVRFEKGTWKGDLPEPGVYSFTFKVQGYESVYRKFQVTAGQKLTMEIRMLMAESDDEAPSAPKAQPAPAAAPKAEPAQPAETAPATVQPEAN